jgi:epoxyqueuosine reductase QueG
MATTSLPLLLGAPPDNHCGECTACCDVIGVRALGKPYYARCKHVGTGCNIYGDRPHSCKIYR